MRLQTTYWGMRCRSMTDRAPTDAKVITDRSVSGTLQVVPEAQPSDSLAQKRER